MPRPAAPATTASERSQSTRGPLHVEQCLGHRHHIAQGGRKCRHQQQSCGSHIPRRRRCNSIVGQIAADVDRRHKQLARQWHQSHRPDWPRSLPPRPAPSRLATANRPGNITFSTATPATTPGTGLNVIQSTTGAGQLILDTAAGSGTGLNGNGGKVTLTPGTGGIQTTFYATGTPLVTNGFAVGGTSLSLSLGFARPSARNSQSSAIRLRPATRSAASSAICRRRNLTTTYQGTPYYLQANYLGGDGNDLVLTNIPGAAAQVAVTSQPPATVTAGSAFSLTVASRKMHRAISPPRSMAW